MKTGGVIRRKEEIVAMLGQETGIVVWEGKLTSGSDALFFHGFEKNNLSEKQFIKMRIYKFVQYVL